MTARSAVVVGATGLVGGLLVGELLRDPDYASVVVLARRPLEKSHPKLEVRVVDFDRLEVEKVDATDAFCALGTTIKKAGSQEAFRRVDFDYVLAFAKAVKPSAERFVLVTSYGADAGSSLFYNRVKGEIEAAVRALELPTTHVLRPSILDGDRAESRPAERVGIAAARLLRAIPLKAAKRAAAISATVVARAMVRLAKRDDRGFFTYESDELQDLGA